MAVKVQFEIGHAAKLKSKKTPEGFTHDWELFVKGTNKHDISHFVEKVVFNLHDSFPKPKRVIKDAPYVLKESGYAGFNLPIDIYFKNRDEPKRVTYNYDLSLQNTGPPSSSSQFKKFVFNNPSDEFRRKLLKGGGVPLVNALDEKSRDSNDALLTKQKINSDANKKHKIRPDDTKTPTFDTLFGPPITKTTKVSPDPKNKSSPNVTAATKSKSSEKALTPSSSTSKEKSEKKDKKEKHKHSPHKEKGDTTPKETRKSNIEEKHERRDEKKKDKSHSKDRDRSKEKNLKRPASPKRFPSPKRSSPVRTIVPTTTNRNDDGDTTKNATRRNHSETSGIVNSNISDKMPNSSSNSSSKKAKKEKKSHDKDKERERKEKDRERKEKEDRPASSNSVPITPNVNSTSNSNITAKAATSEAKVDFIKKESVAPTTFVKDQKEKKQLVDVKTSDAAVNQNIEKKLSEKHDNKDIEKKHKHKKRDKAKEREKDKDYVSKDKKKEKSIRQKDDNMKKNLQGQLVVDSNANQKPNPLNTLMNEISEGDSSDSDDESHTTPSVTEKPENVVETSNSSMPDVVVTKPSPSNLDNLKTEKKERKSREKLKGEDRKRKRKSKEDNDSQSRKSTSPVVSGIGEPASKQIKKDITIKSDKSMSPHVISQSSSISNNSMLAPPTTKNNNADDISFRAPAATPTAGPSSGNNYQSTVNHDRSLTVDYMSELRELQKKIMTLQDNKELQQVVEMIAATGRFEVTSKTFDFDLCALDRHTVQRLQDFFATSCS